MKVPVSWLLEHVGTSAPVEELAQVLTMGGLEVEAVTRFAGRGGWATDVLETYVTPNRGDLLSVVGVARETAALLDCPFRFDEPPPLPASTLPAQFAVWLEAPDLCPRYAGILVRGATIGPSPDWLVNKMEAAGLRSVNNIVDITNFVMLELGQPLHAFDFDDLAGAQIVVRRATPGESLELIDHTERELRGHELVIADASCAVAVAGVMGGVSSEISAATESILIESAHFAPASVRRTAREQGVATEASFRFERTVDPGGCLRAAIRAAHLMVEWAGGEVIGPPVDAVEGLAQPPVILLPVERVNGLLGTSLSADVVAGSLRRLGLGVEPDGDVSFRVAVPTFRPDLKSQADLIEEVARVVGYNGLPERLPVTAAMVGGKIPALARSDELAEVLLASGLMEISTQSIADPEDLDRLGLPADDERRAMLRMENPLAPELSAMRTQLLASLLRVVAHNQRRQVPDLAAFEIARTYHAAGDGRPTERRKLGLALYGSNVESAWNLDTASVAGDFFRLKSAVEVALRRLTGVVPEWRAAAAAPFDPSCCAEVLLGEQCLGQAGRVADEVLEAFGAAEDVFVAELGIDSVLAMPRARVFHSPLPRYPAVNRDLALVLDRAAPAAAVAERIASAGAPMLEEVSVFDHYEGKSVASGRKSVAYSLVFRDPDRTLTNEEVDEAMSRIISVARSEFGAEVRE